MCACVRVEGGVITLAESSPHVVSSAASKPGVARAMYSKISPRVRAHCASSTTPRKTTKPNSAMKAAARAPSSGENDTLKSGSAGSRSSAAGMGRG